jgi:DNA-binding NarL/FixJ family response regulator
LKPFPAARSIAEEAGAAPAPPISVFVVEDLDPIREAFALLLGWTPGFACVGAAASAEAALDAAPEESPDVVLLDIGLPGMTGLEALGPLRQRWPETEFLMLTVHDDPDRVFEALKAGASGYLVKTTPPAEVLAAIRELHAGGAPMSASVARKVVAAFRRPDPASEGLSRREREVLDHLVDGKTVRQIADALFVSPTTVAFHVRQIYDKLHVHSRAEAVARALGGRRPR